MQHCTIRRVEWKRHMMVPCRLTVMIDGVDEADPYVRVVVGH